jgi:hypothetical protein
MAAHWACMTASQATPVSYTSENMSSEHQRNTARLPPHCSTNRKMLIDNRLQMEANERFQEQTNPAASESFSIKCVQIYGISTLAYAR